MLSNNENIAKWLSYFFCLIPISLVSGPFIPDLLVSLIAIFFLYILYSEKKFFYLKEKKNLLFIFFCIFISIRALFSTDILNSIIPSISYIRFGLFVLAAVYLIKKVTNFERNFTKCLLYTILFVSIDAYIQIIFGYNILGIKNEISDRVSGLFGSEYVLGSYLVRMFPLLLALSIDKIDFNLRNKCIFIIGIVLFNLLVFYTAERTAFVLNIVFFLTLIIVVKKTRWLLTLTILFSLIPISIAVNLDKKLHDRMIKQTFAEVLKNNKVNVFSEGHQNHMISALKMFKDNKLFGKGIKNFRVLCKKPEFYEKITSCSSHPHNTYVQLLAETGLIGFSFVFFIFLFICKELLFYFWRSFFDNGQKVDNQKIIITILIFVNLFPLAPSGSFFNNWLSIIYFLPLGFYLNRLK